MIPAREASRLLLAAPVLLLAPGAAAAQSPIYTFQGDDPADQFGIWVSAAGDVDGDGVTDLIAGAPGDDPNGSRSGSARVLSGATGAVLHVFDGDATFDFCGISVDGAGDVDADGFADLVVGANGVGSIGNARVFSGQTGTQLYTFNGDQVFDNFGLSVSGAGDVDVDGFADVIVGAHHSTGNFLGYARVYSGASGAMLYDFVGSALKDEFGFDVSGAGDLNGDGHADLLVGVRLDDNLGGGANENSGSVQAFSGMDGSLLYGIDGSAPNEFFGESVSGAGDVDGDSVPDLIVGARGATPNGSLSGSARVFSGSTGNLLLTFDGDAANDWFGLSVSGAGDLNGDGSADLIVGAPQVTAAGGAGYARVFSGATGTPFFTVTGDSADDELGRAVSDAGDLNLDGAADVFAGAFQGFSGPGAGYARAYSGAPLPLSADVHELSLFQGGTQTFALDAGATFAGQPYLLLGSFSGTQPGFPIDSVLIPLNFDPYFDFTLTSPNVPPLSNSLGVLDGAGQASAALTLPAGTVPSLAGATAHHAFIVLASLQVAFASNAVPVTFLP